MGISRFPRDADGVAYFLTDVGQYYADAVRHTGMALAFDQSLDAGLTEKLIV